MWQFTLGSAGCECDLVGACEFTSQLPAGVTRPNDEHRSIRKLFGMRIAVAMQVLPGHANPSGELRVTRLRESPGRSNHVAGSELIRPGFRAVL